MTYHRFAEFAVGVLILIGLLALLVLAFKVSGFSAQSAASSYTITADFDNIGSLKVRAPVSIGGVTIGRVSSISLDPITFRAKVILQIDNQYNQIPVDSSASIFTEGLLGANYVSLTPGVETNSLQPNANVQTTHSALVLENLIGELLFSLKSGSNKN